MNDQRSSAMPVWHGTTIMSVRKNGKVIVAGDGQVSMGQTVMKPNARKVRRLHDGSVNVVGPCPIESFNTAAFGALSASNPTQPLPPEYPSDKAFFTVTFFYNESPR